jgi:hypothetical protein
VRSMAGVMAEGCRVPGVLACERVSARARMEIPINSAAASRRGAVGGSR